MARRKRMRPPYQMFDRRSGGYPPPTERDNLQLIAVFQRRLVFIRSQQPAIELDGDFLRRQPKLGDDGEDGLPSGSSRGSPFTVTVMVGGLYCREPGCPQPGIGEQTGPRTARLSITFRAFIGRGPGPRVLEIAVDGRPFHALGVIGEAGAVDDQAAVGGAEDDVGLAGVFEVGDGGLGPIGGGIVGEHVGDGDMVVGKVADPIGAGEEIHDVRVVAEGGDGDAVGTGGEPGEDAIVGGAAMQRMPLARRACHRRARHQARR